MLLTCVWHTATATLRLVGITALAFVACQDSINPELQEVWSLPAALAVLFPLPLKATGLAWSSCHADFEEKGKSDGLIRCGHTIVGVVNRQKSQWKQVTPETYQRTAGGAGGCYQQYLQAIPPSAVDPLAIPESQAKALMAYFDYVTKQEASSAGYAGPKFTYAPLAPEEAKLAAQKIMKLNGDRGGWKLYGRSCAT